MEYYPDLIESEVTVATRFRPEYLCSYDLNEMKLSSILFSSINERADITVLVWTGGQTDPLFPGRLVLEQHIGSVPVEEFYRVDLDTHIDITGSEEIWIGLHIITNGGPSMSHDFCCPAFDGHSNLIYWNGEWTTARQVNSAWRQSWDIMGVATLSDIGRDNIVGYHIQRRRPCSLEEWVGFVQNDVHLFRDLHAPLGPLEYQVRTLYTNGFSKPSWVWLINSNKIIDTFPWYDEFEESHLASSGWETPPHRMGNRHEIWFRSETSTSTGQYYAYSVSAERSTDNPPFIPNNWLISPKFVLPEISDNQFIELRFLIASWSQSIFATSTEFYSFHISTTDKNDPEGFVEVYNETISSASFIEKVVLLSDYAGQSIYFALLHHGGTAILRATDFSIQVVNSTSTDDHVESSVFRNYLLGSYPNPFNPETLISFQISADYQNVTVDIYNIKGQKIRSLVNGEYSAGTHSVVWNGKDDKGLDVGSGIYFYQMKTDEFTATKKLTLMK
jgi:hypothetical protein